MPSRETGLNSDYADEVRIWAKKEIAKLEEALEVDEDGFADSEWFHEKMDKHIKYHLTDAGGDYNYIDETGEHVFGLGPVGTLDGAFEYVGELQGAPRRSAANLSSLLSERALLKEIEELKEENKKLKEANDTFTLGAKRTNGKGDYGL